MWQKVRVQCWYLVLLVILGFSFTSCSAYNKYRSAWFGNNGSSVTSSGGGQAGDNNQNVGYSRFSDDSDIKQSKNGNRGMSGDIKVTVDTGNAEREKPLLDHYQELLARLLQDEKEINQLKEKQVENDITVKKLEASVEDYKAKLEEEGKKMLELEEKNKELKLVLRYTTEHRGPKGAGDEIAEEMEILKVQLIESQIAEVKAKQELIRIKTQYVMEKKKQAQ